MSTHTLETPAQTRTRRKAASAPAGGFWRGLGSGALTVLVLALVALAAACVVAPRLLGAVPLTVLTGSMEPTYSPGDIVVVKPVAPSELHIGDVITFQPVSGDPTLVTHRIVGVTQAGGRTTAVTTRGDANNANDDPIITAQIKGRVLYSVPWVGNVTRSGFGAGKIAAVGAGGALLVYAVVSLVRPSRRRDEADA